MTLVEVAATATVTAMVTPITAATMAITATMGIAHSMVIEGITGTMDMATEVTTNPVTTRITGAIRAFALTVETSRLGFVFRRIAGKHRPVCGEHKI